MHPVTYPLAFVPFYLFFVLVVVGRRNAVNITDGLDGLAIGLMVIAAGALTMLSLHQRKRGVGQLSAAGAQCRARPS